MEAEGWNLTATVRASLSKESFERAISEAEYDLSPVGPADFVLATDKLMSHARAFNITSDRSAVLDSYAAGCKGMPRLALRDGLDEVLAKSTDTFRLPMPGAVWDASRDMIAAAESRLAAFKQLGRPLFGITQSGLPAPTAGTSEPYDRGPSPETDAILAETRRILATAGQRMPRRGRAA